MRIMKNTKLFLVIVTIIVSVLFPTSLALTNDGLHSENVAIVWSFVNNGGGATASTNYKITMSAVETAVGTSHSQNYSMHAGALPGLMLVVNAVIPVTPITTISLIPVNNVVLAWNPDAANCSYKIQLASNPYFEIDTATLHTTLSAGTDSYIFNNLLGDPENNKFMIVQGVNCTGLQTADSNEVGKFEFSLKSGE